MNKKIYALCVWHNKTLDNTDPKLFEQWFKEEHNANIKFIEEVHNKMYNFNDVIFNIEYENEKTLKLKEKLKFRWFEDVFFNNQEDLYYDKNVLKKYPNFTEEMLYTVKDILPFLPKL